MLTDPGQVGDLLAIPFSDQQLAAIGAPLAPAVVIAGAGSGKTTVMAARVVWLVGSGQVQPEQVLGLTFTRKAAGELAGRIRAALERAGLADTDSGEEVISTYDAFAGRLVAEYGLLAGIEAGNRQLGGAAAYRLAAQVVARAEGGWQQLSQRRPATIAERVVTLAGHLNSHLADPAAVVRHAEQFCAALSDAPLNRRGDQFAAITNAGQVTAERVELMGLVADYQRLKTELGLVEFADQMSWAAKLAAEVPWVGTSLRERYAVVLLDEYQDTSSAQATLLRALFSGPAPATGRGHPVTAVGDPCQAIYGWRGAAASNILRFPADFPAASGDSAASYPLTVNRRSGVAILEAANQVAQTIRAEPALTATGIDLRLSAPPDAPAAHVEVARFDTWPEEIEWIADQIVAAQAGGQISAWSDVAVLARRNADLAELYAVLNERGVPAQIIGLGGLLDTPALVDVVATLRLLADPMDNPALIRLLAGVRWAIGPADLALLGRRAAELAQDAPEAGGDALGDALAEVVDRADSRHTPCLLDAVAQPGGEPYSAAARDRFRQFSAEFAEFRQWLGGSVVDLVQHVIDVLQVGTELAVAGGDPDQLVAFCDAVAEYAGADLDASLSGLLALLQAERQVGVGLELPQPGRSEAVSLLSVHRAKGLEWQLVFLPALADSVFPTTRVTDNWLKNSAVLPSPLRGDADGVPQLRDVSNEGMTQFDGALRTDLRSSEDRLAYVGFTRAKRRLVGTTHCWAGQITRPRQPSPYFEVLREWAQRSIEPATESTSNPLVAADQEWSWPALGEGQQAEDRRQAAAMVRTALPEEAVPAGLHRDDLADLRQWQEWADVLLVMARAERLPPTHEPDYFSVTGVSQLISDPLRSRKLSRLAVPQPVNRAERSGTTFHRWVEQRFGRTDSLVEEPAEQPEPELVAAFLSGPYGSREPVAVEVPFTVVLAGQLIRGRIDAVYRLDGGQRYEVVDWKTGRAEAASPLQLALYRLAWAELNGLKLEAVDAVFYEVRSNRILRPEILPDRGKLERLLAEAALP